MNTTLPFTVLSISMHPSLPNDLLATVLLSHGYRKMRSSNISDSPNFPRVALSSICGKTVDNVILLHFSHQLQTSYRYSASLSEYCALCRIRCYNRTLAILCTLIYLFMDLGDVVCCFSHGFCLFLEQKVSS